MGRHSEKNVYLMYNECMDELNLEWERLSKVAGDLWTEVMEARQKLRDLEAKHQEAASASSAAYMALEKAKYPKAYL